jgi:hypothetical protein
VSAGIGGNTKAAYSRFTSVDLLFEKRQATGLINLEATTMVTRTAFGGSSVSKGMVAFIVAALAAVLVALVVGYWVSSSHSAIATSTVSSQYDGARSDMATRTLRSGHQTMEGPSSTGPAAGSPRKRFGGVQP